MENKIIIADYDEAYTIADMLTKVIMFMDDSHADIIAELLCGSEWGSISDARCAIETYFYNEYSVHNGLFVTDIEEIDDLKIDYIECSGYNVTDFDEEKVIFECNSKDITVELNPNDSYHFIINGVFMFDDFDFYTGINKVIELADEKAS